MIENDNKITRMETSAPVAGADDQPRPGARRALLIMRRGAQLFGVFADETDGVKDGFQPTPLPDAPRAVLGVIAVRGRMLTALDPSAYLVNTAANMPSGAHVNAAREQTLSTNGNAHAHSSSPPQVVVALCGDEQLALAVDGVEGIVEVLPEEIVSSGRDGDFALGVIQHERGQIVALNPKHLFDAAFTGYERRRQRSYT